MMTTPVITIKYCDVTGYPIERGRLDTVSREKAQKRLRWMHQRGWMWEIYVNGAFASERFRRELWRGVKP